MGDSKRITLTRLVMLGALACGIIGLAAGLAEEHVLSKRASES